MPDLKREKVKAGHIYLFHSVPVSPFVPPETVDVVQCKDIEHKKIATICLSYSISNSNLVFMYHNRVEASTH